MSKYQALVNLSVPRKDGQSDLVMTGDTVELDEQQAHAFLTQPNGQPRSPAVIRPAKEAGQVLPHIPPRALFGSRAGLPGPPEGARPDPVGSSGIQVLERVPEANEPTVDAQSGGAEQDAVDIPPHGRSRQAAGTR